MFVQTSKQQRTKNRMKQKWFDNSKSLDCGFSHRNARCRRRRPSAMRSQCQLHVRSTMFKQRLIMIVHCHQIQCTFAQWTLWIIFGFPFFSLGSRLVQSYALTLCHCCLPLPLRIRIYLIFPLCPLSSSECGNERFERPHFVRVAHVISYFVTIAERINENASLEFFTKNNVLHAHSRRVQSTQLQFRSHLNPNYTLNAADKTSPHLLIKYTLECALPDNVQYMGCGCGAVWLQCSTLCDIKKLSSVDHVSVTYTYTSSQASEVRATIDLLISTSLLFHIAKE